MLEQIYVTDHIDAGRLSELGLAAMQSLVRVRQKGRSPGSLEPDDTAGLDYRVAPGGVLRRTAPALFDLYRSESLLNELRLYEDVECSPDVESSVNVNVLLPGQRYERHVDGWGVTLVCFLTTCSGGDLLVGDDDYPIPARAGTAWLIDGSRNPHQVTSVVAGIRATLLLSYLVKGRHEQRHPDLSAKLYGR